MLDELAVFRRENPAVGVLVHASNMASAVPVTACGICPSWSTR